jgi:DNA-directed RNA polymerase specialized sigma24 family protein
MMREAITEGLMAALEELPKEQRDVFIMHEIEDKSFQKISDLTGANVNTLLSRKRYAVLFLRERLQNLYKDL